MLWLNRIPAGEAWSRTRPSGCRAHAKPPTALSRSFPSLRSSALRPKPRSQLVREPNAHASWLGAIASRSPGLCRAVMQVVDTVEVHVFRMPCLQAGLLRGCKRHGRGQDDGRKRAEQLQPQAGHAGGCCTMQRCCATCQSTSMASQPPE